MADLAEIRVMAEALIRKHLDASEWSFTFDRARRRVGLCNYNKRVISVSRHYAAEHDLREMEQVVLHEIAHAIAGHAAAHGPAWRAHARRIGYRGERTTPLTVSHTDAPWIGRCPSGHEHARYRRPQGRYLCRTCLRSGLTNASMDALIEWQRRR